MLSEGLRGPPTNKVRKNQCKCSKQFTANEVPLPCIMKRTCVLFTLKDTRKYYKK